MVQIAKAAKAAWASARHERAGKAPARHDPVWKAGAPVQVFRTVRPTSDGQVQLGTEAHPTSAGAAVLNARVGTVLAQAPVAPEMADRPVGRRRAIARRRIDVGRDPFAFADPVTSDEFYCISAITATLSTSWRPRFDPKTKAGLRVCVCYT